MSPRRFLNLLREAHRSSRPAGVFYPVAFVFTTTLLLPFFVVEPDVFEYEDHV